MGNTGCSLFYLPKNISMFMLGVSRLASIDDKAGFCHCRQMLNAIAVATYMCRRRSSSNKCVPSLSLGNPSESIMLLEA